MKGAKNRTVGLINNANNVNVTTAASNTSGNSTTTMLGPAPVKECANCGKRITERFLLKALDLFWHEDCLKCGCCDCRLGEVGSTLYTKANLILCKRDYLRLFGTTGYCSACNKIIPAFEMVMRAKNNVYHLECFACQQCNHRFCVGDRFYLCENKILCEYDYEERLVFANMAYNPSSLAHIRRQVSNLQPPASRDGIVSSLVTTSIVSTSVTTITNTNGNATVITNGDRRHVVACPNSALVQTPLHHHLSGITSNNMNTVNNSNNHNNNNNNNNNVLQNQHRDDGSSGYGSPDSETFETVQT